MFVMLLCALLLIVVIIVLAVQSSKSKSAANRRWIASIIKQHDLPNIVHDGSRALGLNGPKKTLGVFGRDGAGFLFSTESLAEVGLTPLYRTTTETSGEMRTRRGPQLISAGVGAAVAGPAGLLAGALTGPTQTSSTSSSTQVLLSMELKLRLLSEQHPVVQLVVADVGAAQEMAARLANLIDVRAAPASVHEPLRVTTTIMGQEELSARPALPGGGDRHGWWTRTFGE